MQRFILAVVAASFGLSGSAQAQRQQPVVRPSSRWVINRHSSMALGATVTDAFNEVKTSSGLGAGIDIGYRVTPRLLAYAGFDIYFFNDAATTEIYTLSLHDALPMT